MDPILVPRLKLIGIVASNRERHIAKHKQAERGYRVKAVERVKAVMRKSLSRARAGKAIAISLVLPLPVSYTKHYDRVLGMLRMDTSKEIKLDATDYDCYVRDQWEWSHLFTSNASMYDKSDPLSQRRRRK